MFIANREIFKRLLIDELEKHRNDKEIKLN